MVATLARLVKIHFTPTHVFAPKRGGWPIAVHMSHQFGATILGRNWGSELLNAEGDIRLLFVDDIVDRGRTLVEFLAGVNTISKWLPNLKEFFTGALVYKPRGPIQPDAFVVGVSAECWVVFPWEVQENAEAESKLFDARA